MPATARTSGEVYAALILLAPERRRAFAAHRSVEARAERLLAELREVDPELAELVEAQGPPLGPMRSTT